MSDYESALLETWQRKPDAIPVLLSDNVRKECEIAALREQLAAAQAREQALGAAAGWWAVRRTGQEGRGDE